MPRESGPRWSPTPLPSTRVETGSLEPCCGLSCPTTSQKLCITKQLQKSLFVYFIRCFFDLMFLFPAPISQTINKMCILLGSGPWESYDCCHEQGIQEDKSGCHPFHCCNFILMIFEIIKECTIYLTLDLQYSIECLPQSNPFYIQNKETKSDMKRF